MTIPQAFELALQHHQSGRLGDAEALYRQILVAQPNHPDALHFLGILAHQRGRHDLAVQWIRQSTGLAPNNPAAHCNLGAALVEQRQFDEAITNFRRAIQLQPDYAEAHYNLGVAFREKGRLNDAMACFRRALELNPDYPEAHNNLGAALARQNHLDDAVATYRRAIELQPGYAEAHNNLGDALRIRGQFDEAMAACRRALELKPNYPEAHLSLGNTLKDLGRLDEAAGCCQRALELNPRLLDGHYNLGMTWLLAGNFHMSEACFRQAIACRADFADAHFQLGLLLLLLGRYAEGWREYEWRWRLAINARRLRHFSAPLWHGQSAAGQTLFIHAEQGFGDTLQFARYLPLVRAHSQAARVILECQPALVPLLEQLHSTEIDVVARGSSGEPLPPFDLHFPLLSLPLALQNFEPVAINAPYLQADAGLRARWRERLGQGPGLRAGLAWAGSLTNENGRYRSIKPEMLEPILHVPGIRFVSLQVEPCGPLPSALAAAGVSDFTADIADFSDSAALMTELDLIITVDTATAHLAGALGRPVWVLLPFAPDWRWGLNREDSPWYPTVRLFRQARAGDWEEVLERVAAALRDRCA